MAAPIPFETPTKPVSAAAGDSHDNDDDTPPVPPPKDYPHAVAAAHDAVPSEQTQSCGCEVPESKAGVSQAWPTKTELEQSGSLPVFDAEGNAHDFRSLYADQTQRHLIIFIRHFFCGVCQEYVRTLSSTIPPSLLQSLPVPVNLILISCGDPSRIPGYIAKTGCPFPIYTDPTRALYSIFQFGRTWDLGPSKPDYIQVSLGTTIATGIYQVLRSGTGAWKGGDFMQVGGEMVFYQGKMEFFHRMENTRNHPEMDELRHIIGVDTHDKTPQRKRWSTPVKALRRRMSPRGKSKERKDSGTGPEEEHET